MNLRSFEGKDVRLVDTDGNVYEGYVGDYIFPEDNEPEGVESIVLDDLKCLGHPERVYEDPEEFPREDIKSIEIIK